MLFYHKIPIKVCQLKQKAKCSSTFLLSEQRSYLCHRSKLFTIISDVFKTPIGEG